MSTASRPSPARPWRGPAARPRPRRGPSVWKPAVHERLRETDFGWGEGRTIAEMTAEDPGLVRAFQQDAERGAFPGSEPPAAVAERVCGALRELAAAYEGGTVLVVAHNTAFRIALCALLGIPWAATARCCRGWTTRR